MAQSSLLEKKRVGGPQMGRGPTRKRSRLDAEELLMEVTIFSLLTFLSAKISLLFVSDFCLVCYNFVFLLDILLSSTRDV